MLSSVVLLPALPFVKSVSITVVQEDSSSTKVANNLLPVLSLEFSNSFNESIEIEAFIPPESPVTMMPDDLKVGKKTGPRVLRRRGDALRSLKGAPGPRRLRGCGRKAGP